MPVYNTGGMKANPMDIMALGMPMQVPNSVAGMLKPGEASLLSRYANDTPEMAKMIAQDRLRNMLTKGDWQGASKVTSWLGKLEKSSDKAQEIVTKMLQELQMLGR